MKHPLTGKIASNVLSGVRDSVEDVKNGVGFKKAATKALKRTAARSFDDIITSRKKGKNKSGAGDIRGGGAAAKKRRKIDRVYELMLEDEDSASDEKDIETL